MEPLEFRRQEVTKAFERLAKLAETGDPGPGEKMEDVLENAGRLKEALEAATALQRTVITAAAAIERAEKAAAESAKMREEVLASEMEREALAAKLARKEESHTAEDLDRVLSGDE